MAKHVKMMIYGDPGVGKSVFASKSPNPFFITTDGNYEWLEEFGANPDAHKQVSSWEEFKKVATNKSLEEYDTIVVDLLEDLFKWCEQEFCLRSKIEHVSDIGYGKGYDITRNEFFLEISKLLGKEKNIILISHGVTLSEKDRRGVEHTKYAPSSRIPDKVMDMIEGRLRYCLRAYLSVEEQKDGTLVKKRYLSVIPKENEFGIARGLDESKTPHDIPLDWKEFAKVINLEKVEHKSKKIEPIKDDSMKIPEEKEEVPYNPMRPGPSKEETTDVIKGQISVEETLEEPTQNPELTPIEEPQTAEVKEEPKQVVEEQSRPLTNAEKIAAIKAKLEAIKNRN